MTEFTMMCCGECGIEFSVPQHFYNERRETGKGWHCPNGHSRVFRESLADKFRRERDLAQQQVARLEDEKRTIERQLTAAKKETAKVKKRAVAALCPCCNRHFAQLERHMKTKHPEIIPMPGKLA